MYFLIVGIIMAVGYYAPSVFESAISPWTTLGPLAFVISVSLLVEGTADAKRHKSDSETNNAKCIILRRTDELLAEDCSEREKSVLDGKDVIVNLSKAYYQTSNNKHPETPVATAKDELVNISFQKVRRMDIRQGHIVLLKNREMVPADMILLASSGDNGSAYIETSSIDGETNLKLRTSPHLPNKKCATSRMRRSSGLTHHFLDGVQTRFDRGKETSWIRSPFLLFRHSCAVIIGVFQN